jgi:hypothetical protein
MLDVAQAVQAKDLVCKTGRAKEKRQLDAGGTKLINSITQNIEYTRGNNLSRKKEEKTEKNKKNLGNGFLEEMPGRR